MSTKISYPEIQVSETPARFKIVDDLVRILTSNNVEDQILGAGIYESLNLNKRHKRVLVQKLSESKKWYTTQIGHNLWMTTGNKDSKMLRIGKLDNL